MLGRADRAGLVGLQIKLPVIFVAQRVVAARNLKAEVAHVKVNKIRPFRTALHFTQLHHAVDERGKPVRLIDNDAALLGTLGVVAAGQVTHGLGVAFIRVSGVRRFVADVRQNVLFELGAALDLGGHVVEILGQTSDLIVAFNLDLHIVVAGGDLLRALDSLRIGFVNQRLKSIASSRSSTSRINATGPRIARSTSQPS